VAGKTRDVGAGVAGDLPVLSAGDERSELHVAGVYQSPFDRPSGWKSHVYPLGRDAGQGAILRCWSANWAMSRAAGAATWAP